MKLDNPAYNITNFALRKSQFSGIESYIMVVPSANIVMVTDRYTAIAVHHQGEYISNLLTVVGDAEVRAVSATNYKAAYKRGHLVESDYTLDYKSYIYSDRTSIGGQSTRPLTSDHIKSIYPNIAGLDYKRSIPCSSDVDIAKLFKLTKYFNSLKKHNVSGTVSSSQIQDDNCGTVLHRFIYTSKKVDVHAFIASTGLSPNDLP